MNVFVIPSWYPSNTNPITGIFFREQAIAMAGKFANINIGISTWGQNDERLLLWSGKPISTALKLMNKPKPQYTKLVSNVTEYMTPAYTWSSKIWGGNMDRIIESNISAYEKFSTDVGKPDIIHAHTGFPAGHIARKLSSIYGVPYIVTEHMSPFPHRQFLNQKGMLDVDLAKAYGGSSRNICVSQGLEQKMHSFSINNTVVVPNLVDDKIFIPDIKLKQDEQFTFFSLGRMVPQKGFDILIAAFAQIDGNVKLRIGGAGAFLKKYKKLSQDLGVANRITWLGELDKSSALSEFQNCDAFVLSSRHESMGLVVAEAMACGKPVIATICGGPEEFVNEDCGYLVEAENKKQLRHAMDQMISAHGIFKSQIIRKHFESRFSKAVVCEMIYEIYLQAIDSYKNL